MSRIEETQFKLLDGIEQLHSTLSAQAGGAPAEGAAKAKLPSLSLGGDAGGSPSARPPSLRGAATAVTAMQRFGASGSFGRREDSFALLDSTTQMFTVLRESETEELEPV